MNGKSLGQLMFVSRWLQAPLYLGLILAQGIYVYQFWVELIELINVTMHSGHIEEKTIMLGVLGLIDVVMIANLLIMVIVGGYETFVSRIDLSGNPDKPDWLNHVNANIIKVKLAMAIVGISSIHLLQAFVEANDTSSQTLMWKTIIHMAFLFSALGLAWIDKIMNKPHTAETG